MSRVPELAAQPPCQKCGGKGYETIYYVPDPRRLVQKAFTQIGCECVFASCARCGYSYPRAEEREFKESCELCRK